MGSLSFRVRHLRVKVVVVVVGAAALGVPAFFAATVQARPRGGTATPPPNAQWTGTAHGTQAIFTRDNLSSDPKARVVADGSSQNAVDLSYQFTIAADGSIGGTGKGEYTLATWHLSGTNGNYGHFDCSPPVTGSPFTVSIRGTASGTPDHPNSKLQLFFTLSGAKETNDRYYCGAHFSGFATSSTYTVESLQAVQGTQGVVFVNSGDPTKATTLSQTLTRTDGPTTSGVRTSKVVSRWDFQITTPGCDLFAKAFSEEQAAGDLFAAAHSQIQETHDEFVKWRNEEAFKFVEIGAEKYSILKFLESISHDLLAGAEVVVVYTGPILTVEWIALDVIPAIHQHDAGLAQARKFADAGNVLSDKALADLKTALQQQPACQAASKQAADTQKLHDQARALIETWENNGRGLYMSPTSHEVLDEGAALRQARQILTGGHYLLGVPTRVHAPEKLRVKGKQLRAALPYVQRAYKLQKQALAQQDAALAKSERFRKELQALLRQ